MKHAYTYVVLRYVHDTSTEEFVNVGVVLCAPGAGYADALFRSTITRLSRMFPGFDADHFQRLIRHLEDQFTIRGAPLKDTLDLGDKPANAQELACAVIARDDSAFQWSPMGSGLTADPRGTLEKLFERMVMRYDAKAEKDSRSDEEVWKAFKRPFEEKNVLRRFHAKTIGVPDDAVEFSHAWKNHQWHCMESVSFDLMKAQSIKDKAHSWLGRVTSVQESPEKFHVYYLIGEPRIDACRRAFEQALNVLHKTPVPHKIVREHEAESFAAMMADKIAAHDQESQKPE